MHGSASGTHLLSIDLTCLYDPFHVGSGQLPWCRKSSAVWHEWLLNQVGWFGPRQLPPNNVLNARSLLANSLLR